jgi:glycosyltransferase involved in cell wall biosynthesis
MRRDDLARPQFTVVTPVYNRRDVLHRPFESLLAQTNQDFEWILVDDGSTDCVQPLLEKFQEVASFPVVLLSQANKGKHAAWNYAIREARGELCVQLDSDDVCIPETIETFARLWAEIPSERRTSFSGINVLCFDPTTNEIVGDPYPTSPMDSNNLELDLIHQLQGEHWGCIRNDCLREFAFPDTDMSTCIPESVIWHRLARKYSVRCVNVALRGYFRDQTNALTKRTESTRDLYGDWYANNSLLSEHLVYLWRNPKWLIRAAANTWRYARHASIPFGQWSGALGGSLGIGLLFLPLGEMLYRRDLAALGNRR